MQAFYDAILRLTGLAGLIPDWIGYAALTFIVALVLSLIAALMPIILVWAERKVSADIQDRIGPNRVGPYGMLQTIADAVKLLTKENITPTRADSLLHLVGPTLVFVGAFAPLAAVAWASGVTVADLNIGVLYILAIASFTVVGILIAGWSSNNKWSLLGGMRSTAQIVSYEIPNGLAVLTAVLIAGTLNMDELARMQSGGVHMWLVFRSPFAFIAFFLYLTSSLAETNRVPFDLPEAESELVSGYHTEYSGMRWALFMMSEYIEMLVVNAVAVTLFLGGWTGLLPGEPIMGGWLWFAIKIGLLMYMQVWLRFVLPRLRVDQLMYTAWKVLIPFGFATVLGAAAQVLLGRTGQTVMSMIAWAMFAGLVLLIVRQIRATAHVPRRLVEIAGRHPAT